MSFLTAHGTPLHPSPKMALRTSQCQHLQIFKLVDSFMKPKDRDEDFDEETGGAISQSVGAWAKLTPVQSDRLHQ